MHQLFQDSIFRAEITRNLNKYDYRRLLSLRAKFLQFKVGNNTQRIFTKVLSWNDVFWRYYCIKLKLVTFLER